MDAVQASSIEAEPTKRAWPISAETLAQARAALDAVAPYCTPVAERWDAERERRVALRTPEHLKALLTAQREYGSARVVERQAGAQRRLAKRDSRNPLSSIRRASRTALKAARAHRQAAKVDLKTARRQYPSTLRSVAVRAHAAHVLPAGVASYALSTPADWAAWPVSVSVLAVAANWAVLALGRRVPSVTVEGEGLSAEERQLMERLDPSYWVRHADDRGLAGTVTTPPVMTPAGIVTQVRLDLRWSVPKLKGQADSVRALLGMRTGTRMEIGPGSQGDWAQITARTRSAADGISHVWTPEHDGIGVDEVTGEIVDLPLKPGVHILIAGITGMGKSVSWRPLMLRAIASEGWTGVVIDPKRQEAIGLEHALRTVGQETVRDERLARIYAMVQELTREMHRRQGMATKSDWVPDGRPENRRLLIVIDEGAAIVRMAKQKCYADVMDLLEELWAEARAVGFQFIWATQYPTKSVGVPAAVKENMSARLSLTVGAGEAERAIFGESAQQTGWLPSTLQGVPGRAMVQYRDRGPDPVQLWEVLDTTIEALPEAEPWRAPDQAEADQVEAGPTQLRLVQGEAPAPAFTDAERDVLTALLAAGQPMRHKDLVAESGRPPATVTKSVGRLVERGYVTRDATVKTISATAAAKEVSA